MTGPAPDPARVRRRRAALRRGVAVALAATAVAAAGSAFGVAFTSGATILLVGLGVGAGLAAGLVGSTARIPWLLRVAAILGLGCAGLALAVRSASPPTWLDGIVDGPRRLLTAGLPADADDVARALPYLVTFVATTAVVALVRRARPAAVPLVVGAVLVVGLGVGLVTDDPQPWVVLASGTALLLALAVAGVLVPPEADRRRPAPRAPRRARPLAAAGMVVLVLAVGVVGARAVTAGEERASLRSLVDEEVDVQQLTNPLDVAAELLEADDVLLGTVTVDDPTLRRLPIATFSSYDGETFTFAEEAIVAGERPGVARDASGLVRQDLLLEAWPFATLAHAGPAQTVEGPASAAGRLFVDPEDGRLLVPPPSEGRWVISSLPDAGLGGPTSRFAAPESVPGAADPTPIPPSDLALAVEDADRLREAIPGDLAYAEALAQTFRSTFRAVRPGPPDDAARSQSGGITSNDLGCVLRDGFGPAEASCSRRIGTRLQLAAAYVALARALGIPSRLALGFDLAPSATAQTLRSHQLTAWAEVAVDGVGWVAVDPVPDTQAEAAEVESPEDDGGGGTVDRVPDGDDAGGSDTGDPGEGAGSGRGRLVAALVALGALAVLALALGPGLIRRRRVARRRSGPPTDAVLGAWWEMRDRLREHGVGDLDTATVTEVVRAHVGAGAEAEAVAGDVNAVAFGGAAPDPATAERAWAAVDDGTRRWRSTATRTERARAYTRVGRVRGRRQKPTANSRSVSSVQAAV